MGTTSCRVSRPPLIGRIQLPPPPQLEIKEQIEELSIELNTQITAEDNIALYQFSKEWLGVPYRYGAYSKRGTDCSGFAYNLYKEVYDIDITRTSAEGLRSKFREVSRDDLKEGDLVFFNIRNRRGGAASHVGVYLKDDLFIHATTRAGVIISSLHEDYYKRTYLSAGRVFE